MENIVLNNGVIMPKIGIGTYGITELKLINAVRKATKYGYLLFDTASAYGIKVIGNSDEYI